MNERILQTARGAIIFDAEIFGQISDRDFTAANWPASSSIRGRLRSAGRGNTMIVKGDQGEFVIRHFMRGGLIGRIISDSYFWRGDEASRGFREWRLLSKLAAMELPVPRPAAARYVRSGMIYKADLLTVRIPNVMPLSDRIANRACSEQFWRKLGGEIAAFHASGVDHADLNAYNIQIDDDDRVWLLDFDRGRLRQPGSWQQNNLARLHRSLQKIQRLDRELRFSESDWDLFLDTYFSSCKFA